MFSFDARMVKTVNSEKKPTESNYEVYTKLGPDERRLELTCHHRVLLGARHKQHLKMKM